MTKKQAFIQKLIDEVMVSLDIEKTKEEAIEALRYKFSLHLDEVLQYLFEENIRALSSETPTTSSVRVYEDFKTTHIDGE